MSGLTKYGLCCTICCLPILFTLGSFGPGAAVPSDADKVAPPVVRSAECRWASGPIKIDGTLDEPAWQKAEVLKDFDVFWQHRPAKTATKARLLWDDNYLYFGSELEDSYLYADVSQRICMTWKYYALEI